MAICLLHGGKEVLKWPPGLQRSVLDTIAVTCCNTPKPERSFPDGYHRFAGTRL